MKATNNHPPRWATRLLHFYCKPELAEDLEGDLLEYYHRNVSHKGRWRASCIYIIDVIKFIRLYTLRKPDFIIYPHTGMMMNSYIKTSGRNMIRNKLFSTINIAGLAISMAVGLFMIGTLMDIFSYDRFHDQPDRIYRVLSQYEYLGQKDDMMNATNSLMAAHAVETTFTGIDATAILHQRFTQDCKTETTVVPLSGYYANRDIFRVFSYPLLAGHADKALEKPYSAVLTESAAQKLFGRTDILNQTFTLDTLTYTVTAVAKDLPRHSHIGFDMLLSLASREAHAEDMQEELTWDNVWNTWMYVRLDEGADPAIIQTNLDRLCDQNKNAVPNTTISMSLQPLTDIVGGPTLNNPIGPTLGRTTLWVFGALSAVVLLSACFNYTNLSVARSLRRSREVGIRKVVGARRTHVVGQFLVEAILISILALLFALVIFYITKPYFLQLHNDLTQVLTLDLTPKLLLTFLLFSVLVGAIAGILPALFFSRIQALQVMKAASTTQVFRGVGLRKVLIVFQYALSIILITSTLMVYRQYNHFLHFDLGYHTDNILNIQLQGNDPARVRQVMSTLPEVTAISQSSLVTSVGRMWGTLMKNPAFPNDSLPVRFNIVDEHYIPLHGHRLLAGENFHPQADSMPESQVIVNETVLKKLNIGRQIPTQAIGQEVIVNHMRMTIVGVMRDFQYGAANQPGHDPVVLRYRHDQAHVLNLKIQSTDLVSTYDKIRASWSTVDPIHPLDAQFYDDAIEANFAGMSASVRLAGTLAFLAVCIASMGLLGMVVYATEIRLKEIGIRKVLGAGEGKLVFLLGRAFLILLGVAALVSLPATYLFFGQLVLPTMANHLPLGWQEGIIGTGVVLGIALLMIGTQTLKAARTNPATVLKNE